MKPGNVSCRIICCEVSWVIALFIDISSSLKGNEGYNKFISVACLPLDMYLLEDVKVYKCKNILMKICGYYLYILHIENITVIIIIIIIIFSK